MSMTELGLGKVTDDARTASCNAALVTESDRACTMDQINSYEKTLGHSAEELERLDRQGDYLRDATRNLLWRAGIAKGMHVLDLGAGTGEVSLLAAELVGPHGHVFSVEPSASAREQMAARLLAKGISTVHIVDGSDANLPTILGGFDAVVGRLVLVHVKDPLSTIKRLLQVLRPGGLLVFQEIDIEAACWSEPPIPLVHKCFHWIVSAFTQAGMPKDIGRKLQDAFADAELTHRHIVREGLMEAGVNPLAFEFLARTVKSLAPLIERLRIATPQELDTDTLEARLGTETQAVHGHFIPCYLLNAWARKPM